MNLYNFFKNSISITFILEVFCGFFLIIYLIFFGIFGGPSLFGTETNIFLVLITLGIACLITLLGISFFMRGRDRFLNYLGSADNFPTETLAEKVVLALWIAALCFFGAATFYGFFLIYQFQIFPVYGQAIGIIIVFIIIGIIIVCAILQVFLIIMAKFTKKIVSEVLDN